jgi:multicomponent Na+:H+ antiporter subunit F
MPLDLMLGALGAAFALAMIRVRRGPTIADRAIAGDVALYGVIGAVALLALRQDAPQFLDVVLVATLLGFLASVALSLLIGRERR